MSRYESLRRSERRVLQDVAAQSQDDHFMRECDLNWENDLRRLCWSSDIPREIFDKIINDHRRKQDEKKHMRSREAHEYEDIIIESGPPNVDKNDEEQASTITRDQVNDHDTEAKKEAKPPPSTPLVSEHPPSITAPVIIQEVITHHRHIDHGFETPRNQKRDLGAARRGDVHSDPGANRDEENISIEGSSSSRSSSTSRMPPPHVINAPTVRREVITNNRDIALANSKADRMVDLLETILLTLREEVKVTPMLKSADEANTKASKSMAELEEALDQVSEPQRALPTPAKQKKPRRGKKPAHAMEYA